MEENGVLTTEEQQQNTQLPLYPGMMVEVMNRVNNLIFVGKIEQYEAGAVVIRESSGQDVPPVLYNNEIKMRFYMGPRTMVLYGQICGSSREIWKVDRLHKAFDQEKRAFFHQRVSLDTQAVCIRQGGGGKPSPGAQKCQILDVSAGGLLLQSRGEFFLGDRLSVAAVVIVPEEKPFAFTCLVQRVTKEDWGQFLYGCQLDAQPEKEQDRLLRAIFIAQRRDIQLQKEKGLQ